MPRKGEIIFKRKDGRWEARYKKGIGEDGRTLYGYCYGSTYREAKDEKTAFNQRTAADLTRKTQASGLIL